jgi:hypothetical protein
MSPCSFILGIGPYFFFARRFLRTFLADLPADLSTKKSSRLAPALIAAVNHLG